MTDYGDPGRHKFVVGIYNPDGPDPWGYALERNFDFACVFISRPELQNEVATLPPGSAQFDQVLINNTLLRPSGRHPPRPFN